MVAVCPNVAFRNCDAPISISPMSETGHDTSAIYGPQPKDALHPMQGCSRPWAGALALPALAGLLIVTALTMSEPHRWPERLSQPRASLAHLTLAEALTVLADLTVAIAVGTIIGLAFRLSRWEIEAPR